MRVTVDDKGRLQLPETLRREAGIEPGTEVELRWCGDHLEAEAAEPDAVEPRARLVRDGKWLVVDSPGPPVTVEEVNRLIEEIRDERMREMFGPFSDDPRSSEAP